MSAIQVIRKATAVGIHIAIDGDDLLLEAASPPPTAVLDLLSHHKPDILSLLRSGRQSLDAALASLERACPDYVEPPRWRQCIVDAHQFLARWGRQAEALGWTVRDLFGLHEPPPAPHPSYQRLSRYDETGLLWLLRGHPVIALAELTAAIQTVSGVPIIYRKNNKPALGPMGDSLDDFMGSLRN